MSKETNTFIVTLVVNVQGDEEYGENKINEIIDEIENTRNVTIKDREVECQGGIEFYDDEEY